MHHILSGPLRLESITVAIADLPSALVGTRLVQLSDFHYDGLLLSEALLAQVIQLTQTLEPDLILLTGDYVTHDPSPIRQLVRRLQPLESRAGIYAVLGNHDLHLPHSRTEITEALDSIGIQVLWNQIAYPLGAGLPLVGLADYWSPAFDPGPVMNTLTPDRPRIVLSHNPDTAEVLQPWRVDLQLSGHTHGGQIVLPRFGCIPTWIHASRNHIPQWLWPWIPFLQAKWPKVVRHWEWAQGWHQIGQNRLYVNRGLGTFPPGRLFCPPEVTLITLTAIAAPD